MGHLSSEAANLVTRSLLFFHINIRQVRIFLGRIADTIIYTLEYFANNIFLESIVTFNSKYI
jgi:hypothetical protein